MPPQMKNINLYLTRGQNGQNRGYSDNDMMKIDIQDKKRLHLLKIKILCEDFEDFMEYEIFIDGKWFIRISYRKGKGDMYDIKFNQDFMKQYGGKDEIL